MLVIHPDLFRQFNESAWNFRPGELKAGKPVRSLTTTTRNHLLHTSLPPEGLEVGSFIHRAAGCGIVSWWNNELPYAPFHPSVPQRAARSCTASDASPWRYRIVEPSNWGIGEAFSTLKRTHPLHRRVWGGCMVARKRFGLRLAVCYSSNGHRSCITTRSFAVGIISGVGLLKSLDAGRG
jgi:hypothetical protein